MKFIISYWTSKLSKVLFDHMHQIISTAPYITRSAEPNQNQGGSEGGKEFVTQQHKV
ncbi:unnamed protein product [Brassica oleracea var. botrytis]